MFRERPGEMVWEVGREAVAESSEEPGTFRCEYSESRKKNM